ncbi:MAG: hypothetical protein ACOYEC_03635 [Christensenellales bacterium]|jgi:hypothetical protein|nr:hypothetical protein [Clostridiales bacterium]
MKLTTDKLLFRTKIFTLAALAAQITLFFLPINMLYGYRYSMVGIWIKILGEAFWSDIQNIKKNIIFILSSFAIIMEALAFAGLFATKERKRYKAAAMTFFLISAVTYAFCFGALINAEGFADSLYGFNFLSLILTIIVIVATLRIPIFTIPKKEI